MTYKFYIISDIGFARNFLAHAEKESKFNIRWKKKLAKNAKKAAKVRRENEQKHAKAMFKRWKKISKEQEKQKKFTFL